MRRPVIAAALVLVLAAPLLAETTLPEAEAMRAYNDRLIAMDPTAAGHAELAAWCEAHGLADRAEKHWQEALALDPEMEAAREALASEAAAEDDGLRPSQVAFRVHRSDATVEVARRRQFYEQLRAIEREYLHPYVPDLWAEGRERVLMMRDPGAAAPIAQVVADGGAPRQKLAAEALAAIPGQEARDALVSLIMTTPDADVYQYGLKQLTYRADGPHHPPFLRALRGRKDARNRAAYALGELKSWSAVPALIEVLKARESRVMQAPARAGGGSSGSGAYIAVGRVVTYVKDATPVVAEGAVAWDPVIGAITTGSVLSVSNPVVTGRKVIVEFVGPQPAVREALRKITGKDFGYDQAVWRTYLRDLREER